MGNTLVTDILFGGILATSLWWYLSNKEFALVSEKLGYLENSFKNAEFLESLDSNAEGIFQTYDNLSNIKPPKYLKFIDPLKYYFLKKKYSKLKNQCKDRLNSFNVA